MKQANAFLRPLASTAEAEAQQTLVVAGSTSACCWPLVSVTAVSFGAHAPSVILLESFLSLSVSLSLLSDEAEEDNEVSELDVEGHRAVLCCPSAEVWAMC